MSNNPGYTVGEGFAYFHWKRRTQACLWGKCGMCKLLWRERQRRFVEGE